MSSCDLELNKLSDTPIELTQGDDYEYDLKFTYGKDPKLPLDITGAIVYFTIRNKPAKQSGSEIIVEKKVINHTNPAQGETAVSLTHDDTDIAVGTYYYDMQYTSPSVKIKTFLRGTLKITWQSTEKTNE